MYSILYISSLEIYSSPLDLPETHADAPRATTADLPPAPGGEAGRPRAERLPDMRPGLFHKWRHRALNSEKRRVPVQSPPDKEVPMNHHVNGPTDEPLLPGNGTGTRGDAATSPFLVENETAYRRWRALKLASFIEELTSAADAVDIADPDALSNGEYTALTERCRRRNFAFYRTDARAGTSRLKQLWARVGLRTPVANPRADRDGISRIEDTPGARYIPYTTRPLKWHTDGYYNDPADTIRAFAMHCARPAGQGGENQYFDPEILYILLRDENPDYIVALMHPQALTVPRNSEATYPGGMREARSVPVLALDPQGGDLVTRYTGRSRYVSWRGDKTAAEAHAFIEEVLRTPSNYRVTRRLDAGEGVVCNNVLHNRGGFSDTGAPSRLLYRARYRERVAQTRPGETATG